MRPRYAIRDCAAFKQSVRQVRCSCNSQIGIANQTKCGLTTFAVARKKGTEMVAAAVQNFDPARPVLDTVDRGPDRSDRREFAEALDQAGKVRIAGTSEGLHKETAPADHPGNLRRIPPDLRDAILKKGGVLPVDEVHLDRRQIFGPHGEVYGPDGQVLEPLAIRPPPPPKAPDLKNWKLSKKDTARILEIIFKAFGGVGDYQSWIKSHCGRKHAHEHPHDRHKEALS
jgi:hypothetical protein